MVKLNIQECKWFIILSGFTYFIYKLLLSEKIYYFVHPRMVKYIKFSFVFFCILTFVQLLNIFKADNHHEKRKISVLAFLLPLILGLFFNPQQLNSELASRKGVNFVQNNINTPAPTSSESLETISKDSDLVVDTNNFTQVTDDILYSDSQKYKGKLITITGFVYKDTTLSSNEFVTGRLMMVCCAADTGITGLLCEWDNVSKLKSDEWIKVTGILDSKVHKFEGREQTVPYIKVQKVEPSKKPENQYVYPE
jgi:putative membrane protein